MVDKFYVYSLTTQGEDKPFYIGKGFGDRAKEHLKLSERDPKQKNTKEKCLKPPKICPELLARIVIRPVANAVRLNITLKIVRIENDC